VLLGPSVLFHVLTNSSTVDFRCFNEWSWFQSLNRPFPQSDVHLGVKGPASILKIHKFFLGINQQNEDIGSTVSDSGERMLTSEIRQIIRTDASHDIGFWIPYVL